MSKTSKRNYAYFIVPIAGVIVFLAFYLNFVKAYDIKQQKEAAAENRAKAEAIEQQNKERLIAVKKALADQARAKAEQARKAAREARQRDELANDYQLLNKTESDLANYKDQTNDLQKDVASLQDEIKQIREDESVLEQQRKDVDVVTERARGNVESLQAVIDKIQAADQAATAAAAAAAAAKKKS